MIGCESKGPLWLGFGWVLITSTKMGNVKKEEAEVLFG